MTADAFKRSLKHHQDRGFFKNLKILRGIERESLRVTQEGKISQSNHPKSLGSPLTSEDITTDFAEALVELVTPTFESAEELFEHLSLLHKFLYSEMEEEILWNFSMPCAFQNEKEIKIAEYGDTNSGMLKHIYRKGLRLRYGSIMQCVSGIHFNFSLSIDSWDTLTNTPDQSFVNEKYLGAIRNIKRNFWFLLERLGASPIAHESYLLNREHSLTKHGSNDLFLPCATSLRMSDVGYQSSMQNALKINYNNLDEFIDAIIKGINTPVKNFEEIGLLDELGVPQQISTGILQIENELYDTVRPKRSGPSGSRPATLLKNEGIEYLELRGIDINPFIPEGIDENKIKLLDIFIMHSLISESPQVSDKEIEEIRANQKTMVENGRSENVNLEQNGVSTPLKELKKIFYNELEQVATSMDEYCPGYSNALSAEMSENLLPSEKIMNEMNAQNLSFQEYGLAQSKKIAAKQQSHAGDDFSKFTLNAKKSLKDFKNLNKNAGMDINKYVELYNSKI
jgi:glutamate--cysteine ligase